MTIASRLDEAMKAAGFKSQSALSRASGIPQPTINRILKGVGTKGPEAHTLALLAAACNVAFDWLHEGIGEPARTEKAKRGNGEKPSNVDADANFQSGGQLAPPIPDNFIDADELLKLIALYRQANALGRLQIMDSAEIAEKSIVAVGRQSTKN